MKICWVILIFMLLGFVESEECLDKVPNSQFDIIQYYGAFESANETYVDAMFCLMKDHNVLNEDGAFSRDGFLKRRFFKDDTDYSFFDTCMNTAKNVTKYSGLNVYLCVDEATMDNDQKEMRICVGESKVDIFLLAPFLVNASTVGIPEDHKNLASFFRCIFEKKGELDKDGNVDLSHRDGGSHGPDIINEIREKCLPNDLKVKTDLQVLNYFVCAMNIRDKSRNKPLLKRRNIMLHMLHHRKT